MKRMAHLGKIKQGYENEYIEKHKHVSQEMRQAYKDAGYINISSFILGTDLIVTFEIDEEVYNLKKGELNNHPEMIKWRKLVKDIYDKDFKIELFEEVFHME